MTSRELRTRRRAEERKLQKQANKQLTAQPTEPANAEIGFVSQNTSPAAPINEPRTQTNRQNAQFSTGPRIYQGKLASSRNSTKHGLSTGQIIIPGEDSTAFEALLTDLLADHQPANASEELLVKEMAQSHWLTQRAIRLQNDCFTAEGIDAKQLALLLRYQTTHQRAFHKALAALMAAQKTRRKAEIGFVSQNAFVSHQPPPDTVVKMKQFHGDRQRAARHPGVSRLQSQGVA